MTATTYGDAFFEGQQSEGARSADIVVPEIVRVVPQQPRSVLDVGCGIGVWLAVWVEHGAEVLGIDGDYVNRELLLIPPDRFVAHDLSTPLDLGQRFDVVTCLEVAEHLEEGFGPVLIASLVRHGDTIIFSAAPPGQDGTHHVNLQWPSYWAAIFREHGYRALDAIRPAIWGDDRVSWWYRQNIILFVKDSDRSIDGDMALLDRAHPALVASLLDLAAHPGGRAAVSELARILRRRIPKWSALTLLPTATGRRRSMSRSSVQPHSGTL